MIDWTEIEGVDFAEDAIEPEEIKATLDRIEWFVPDQFGKPDEHVALMSYEDRVVLVSAAIGYGQWLEAHRELDSD